MALTSPAKVCTLEPVVGLREGTSVSSWVGNRKSGFCIGTDRV